MDQFRNRTEEQIPTYTNALKAFNEHFLRYFPVYFTRQKTTWTFLMFLYPICDFKYIFCNHLTFLFKSTEISLKQKALFPLCSLRTIACRCNGVASNLFYRQMHITCIIIK